MCNNHTNSVLGFPAVCVTDLLVSTSDTLILGDSGEFSALESRDTAVGYGRSVGLGDLT